MNRSTLHPIAEAERLRRLSRYPAQLRNADPARRLSRQQAEADAAIWQALVDWLRGNAKAEADWPGFASATRSAARSAMRAHLAAPADAAASARATSLCSLARNIAICAWSRGVPDAMTAYDRAMDIIRPTSEREAA